MDNINAIPRSVWKGPQFIQLIGPNMLMPEYSLMDVYNNWGKKMIWFKHIK